MDTNKKEQPVFLDFTSFIKKHYPQFVFDSENGKIISQLGLWATRNEKFNNQDSGWHIDRGLLLIGPVGVGKDEIFRILKTYLSYLQSPYTFKSKVVWGYTKPFLDMGYDCFNDDQAGNIYYEELGLTDDKTGYPTREEVNRYGNKILVGSEIIMTRYNVFKNTAYQSHFSTNLDEAEIEKVYGSRCMSRLYEMCNLVFLKGKDRRGVVAPKFNKNKISPLPPRPREVTVDEHLENKASIEAAYAEFITQGGKMPASPELMYNLMASYCGGALYGEEEMRVIMEDVEGLFEEAKEMDKKLQRMSKRELESEKVTFVWAKTRQIALYQYFTKLQQAGAKSVFGERSVNDNVLNQAAPGGEK